MWVRIASVSHTITHSYSHNHTRVQAQSGTGKTSTLAIIGLQVCDVHKREVQVLILSPTREIATQLESTMNLLGAHMSLLVHCCIGALDCVFGVFLRVSCSECGCACCLWPRGAGGKSVSEDVRKLEHGQHIVTGTPGRVHDMIQRKTFRTYLHFCRRSLFCC